MAGESKNISEAEEEKSAGRKKLEGWLNKTMRIRMTDGRTLVGVFLCTDKDKNVILGSCQEYLKLPESGEQEDPRVLGLAMVPGRHLVSIEVDQQPEIM
ncbi:N-alpha-acetyltransferase 38, NatC auxiliary subunit-like [Lingula anatina]|uniref:N-alpha-acetyltransferase 38, NatC auxiliary subunit-like n=1 Tax=Lingula anatina TaxID=7574 RepID=A0A1S3I4G4_LINAN|nr:N-alpha-acetyltransferase 38, NatC auxiliary subunit-like [Lingula anatina]|eukprot:XP_013393113.1 N-alpha-acetyltransferase 38, NatC auxiliary subunit-like [Lingula anatina]